MTDGRQPSAKPQRRGMGFTTAGHLLKERIGRAGESRGFAVTRLLTHWSEVVGADLARLCEPVKVGYAPRGGIGATLTLLVRGAAAPIVQAQSETIRARINACYGYNAIAKVRLTQTAAAPGFAEPQSGFAHSAASEVPPAPPPDLAAALDPIADPELRAALAGLGARVHARKTRG